MEILGHPMKVAFRWFGGAVVCRNEFKLSRYAQNHTRVGTEVRMVRMSRPRQFGIVLISIFAIVSGINEVVVGLTGNFLGILSTNIAPSLATVVVGVFYSLAGLSLLTMKKLGAGLGIVFLSAEILGRIYLVLTGIAPSKGTDALKIVMGALIALGITVYVGLQWKIFD